MELNSAKRIAEQFINKIKPAILTASAIGQIKGEKPKVTYIEVEATVNDRRLLDALLLECSTPISSSERRLVRLFQNVKIILYCIEGTHD